MPFCPDCGTEVSEDTRFCPECGHPFMIVGQAGNGKNKKKKIAGIIAACIVAISVIVVIATHPPTSMDPEPEIPAHFTTYTDELGLFSISYPPEWELASWVIEETEQAIQDIMSSIASDLPVEEASTIFFAGLPTGIGYIPNVNIVVESLPGIMWTHDKVVTAEIEGLKAIVSDYYEFSRVKTTIDNRTATIIEFQGNVAGLGTYHDVAMIFLVNKTAWVVMCTAFPDEYSEWEDDFDAIVRSLRIVNHSAPDETTEPPAITTLVDQTVVVPAVEERRFDFNIPRTGVLRVNIEVISGGIIDFYLYKDSERWWAGEEGQDIIRSSFEVPINTGSYYLLVYPLPPWSGGTSEDRTLSVYLEFEG